MTPAFVEDHVLRYLYTKPQSSGAQIAAACGLGYQAGISSVLDGLRQDHQVEIRGQRGIGDAGYAYVLTSKGAARAAEALERTQYTGPLPVSPGDYLASVNAQPVDRRLVTRDRVRDAFADLLAPQSVSDRIGPSINSGSALFLFGAPGNGKTAMAERIVRVLSDPIYIPHALEVDGAIVKLFDPLVHRPVQCGSTQMLVFATNLEPGDLADDAFLRRIRFKLRLEDPTPEQFGEIFRRECSSRGLEWSPEGLRYILERWMVSRPLRMCQPRDLVSQIVAIAEYQSMRPDPSSHALLDEACSSYFAAAA